MGDTIEVFVRRQVEEIIARSNFSHVLEAMTKIAGDQSHGEKAEHRKAWASVAHTLSTLLAAMHDGLSRGQWYEIKVPLSRPIVGRMPEFIEHPDTPMTRAQVQAMINDAMQGRR